MKYIINNKELSEDEFLNFVATNSQKRIDEIKSFFISLESLEEDIYNLRSKEEVSPNVVALSKLFAMLTTLMTNKTNQQNQKNEAFIKKLNKKNIAKILYKRKSCNTASLNEEYFSQQLKNQVAEMGNMYVSSELKYHMINMVSALRNVCLVQMKFNKNIINSIKNKNKSQSIEQ